MMLVIIYFLTFNRTNIFGKEIENENMTEQHKNSNEADVMLEQTKQNIIKRQPFCVTILLIFKY